MKLNVPLIGEKVRAMTSEFKICDCIQHSALAAIQRKTDGLVDSACLVLSFRVFALHQPTHVRVIWASDYRLALVLQFREGQVGTDVELAHESRRNGRHERDRAGNISIDVQFVQAFWELQRKEHEH